jgi:hypothetical protein
VSSYFRVFRPGAGFLDEIQTKVLRVFLLAIHSHLYSFALRFLFLQTYATSYSFYSLVIVHCKGERRKTKPDRKLHPLPYGLRNLYRHLKSGNSQDYVQKPQRNCMFMNSASSWEDSLCHPAQLPILPPFLCFKKLIQKPQV